MITKEYIKENGLELFEDSIPYTVDDSNTPQWEISEADSQSTGIVDGTNILGRAVGKMFVVDDKSQNNRFYERRLWERVIREGQQTIQRGQMLGTMGHSQPLDDAALLEGRVSHRVSKLWVDESKRIGMGEILILNTPSGRVLNTYLRSGVEYPVSSRGYGKYSGTMEDGTRIVDSDTFKLEGFDFVRVPGVPSAIPRIVEAEEAEMETPNNAPRSNGTVPINDQSEKSDEKEEPLSQKEFNADAEVQRSTTGKVVDKDDNNNNNNDGDDDGDGTDDEGESNKEDEETAESRQSTPLGNPKKQQSEELDRKRSPQVEQRKVYNTMEESVLARMTEEKIRLEENLREALRTNAQLHETIVALQEATEEYQMNLQEYRQLGSTEDLSRVMDVTEAMLQNRPVEESDFVQLREQLEIYEELGTPDDLEELFDKFESFMNQYEELGTPDDVDAALESSAALLEEYTELGSPLDVNEAFDSVEEFMSEMNQLGTVAELHGVCDLLEAYQEFGTPRELQRAFEMMNSLVETTTVQHITSEGRQLAAEFGIDQQIAESVVAAMGSAQARETFGAINEGRGISSRYVAPRGNTGYAGGHGPGNMMNEDAPRGYSPVAATLFNNTPTSRGRRLIDKMSR